MSAINPASFAIMAEPGPRPSERAHRGLADEKRRVEEEAVRFHNYPAFFHQAFDTPGAGPFYGPYAPPAMSFGQYQNYAGYANGQSSTVHPANTGPSSPYMPAGHSHAVPSFAPAAASFAPAGQQSPGLGGRIAFGSFPSSASYGYPQSQHTNQSADNDLEDVQKHLRGLGIGKEPSFSQHGSRQGTAW
ncbi:hypothetical protein P152DRAFT_290156 [Eremomyces bilateralis CBS 781.70]|uniref:Uncharacterized protein n=1 Tax=Eremomyces bilateralis CBS 781.70 TaxID=1392243 RepID=A0A6G1G6S0_9PEZI|nr:uncharacterized protein P152DRAFT_290156 [Eremomyces bilateralis CBS 781.70]KAF1813743.1 hypothetical protein P152DRAFT_290156 [Eremomyces bilateralis CBS 781.70]